MTPLPPPDETLEERFEPYVLDDEHLDRAPTMPSDPVVAQASGRSPHEVRAAVRWVAGWKDPYDGTAIVTRRMALALDAAGRPVFLPPAGLQMRYAIDPLVLHEVEKLYERQPRSQPIHFHHLVPSETGVRAALYPSTTMDQDPEGAEQMHRRKILFSVWEQMPSSSWASSVTAIMLQKFAAHIVPCEHNAEVLRRAGVPAEKITVIHHPFDEREADALSAPRDRNVNRTVPYRFYTMGKWEPRKDQVGVMRAFLRAFVARGGWGVVSDAPQPTLNVITSPWWEGKGYPKLEEAIAYAAATENVPLAVAKALIRVDTKRRESMVDVHRHHDCFVSASHGEAWGMPAHDACIAGNLLLVPHYAGFAEFAKGHPPVPFREGPVDFSDYAFKFQPAKPTWAHVDVDVLAQMMSDAAFERPAPPSYFDGDNFARQNPVEVGQQLRRVIDHVIGDGYAWHLPSRRPQAASSTTS